MRRVTDIILGIFQIIMLLAIYIFLIVNSLEFIKAKECFLMYLFVFGSIFMITKLLIFIVKDFIRENIEEYK